MAIDKLDVIAKSRRGFTPDEIAKLMGTEESAVQKILDEAKAKGAVGRAKKVDPAKRVTHEERAQLRKEIAEYLASGKTIEQATQKFNVRADYVNRSAKEHGIEPKAKKYVNPGVSFFDIIVKMLERPDVAEAAIARDLGCTRQYVNLARQAANASGLFLAIERVKAKAVEEAIKAAKKK